MPMQHEPSCIQLCSGPWACFSFWPSSSPNPAQPPVGARASPPQRPPAVRGKFRRLLQRERRAEDRRKEMIVFLAKGGRDKLRVVMQEATAKDIEMFKSLVGKGSTMEELIDNIITAAEQML